ncbi:MAG: site-specific integrase [Dysosmobacter welbionis]
MAKRRPSGDGMVRKREDGRWEGRIVVGHKQNGEPIFRYVLAKTQKELLDKLHRDLEAFQDVELTEDSRMTLGEWLDRWMEDYGAATLRPNTLRSYEQFIRCYIKPYLGDKIVSRVTRMDIQKLYRKLKHEGRVREHPEYGYELSDTMVLRIHAMLHRCLKDAEAAHVVARNPTDGAVVPKANHRPKQILTKEQVDIPAAAVDRNGSGGTSTRSHHRPARAGSAVSVAGLVKAGLKILRSVNVRPGAGVGEMKTSRGRRTIRLPPSTVQRLKERKKHASDGSLEPLAWEAGTPQCRLLLDEANFRGGAACDPIPRFKTFATTPSPAAWTGTLSGIWPHQRQLHPGHYTHVTPDMQRRPATSWAAWKISWGRLKPWQKNRTEGGALHG